MVKEIRKKKEASIIIGIGFLFLTIGFIFGGLFFYSFGIILIVVGLIFAIGGETHVLWRCSICDEDFDDKKEALEHEIKCKRRKKENKNKEKGFFNKYLSKLFISD
ncbi:MAG: hypothetical protein ABIJ18_01325 [archaeon]